MKGRTFRCSSKLTLNTIHILHKHCLHFLLRDKIAPRETENNAYAKFWGDKQTALWYVMVFSGVVNFIGSLCSSWRTGWYNVLVYAKANKQISGYCVCAHLALAICSLRVKIDVWPGPNNLKTRVLFVWFPPSVIQRSSREIIINTLKKLNLKSILKCLLGY